MTDKERIDFLERAMVKATGRQWISVLLRLADLGLHLSLRHAIDAAIKEEQ